MMGAYPPFFRNIQKGIFKSRLNRFIVECTIEDKTVSAYLPNSGRLWELLLPGRTLYLTQHITSERNTSYTVAAVEKDGMPVMLHTHLTNTVVQRLIEQNKIRGLEGASILKWEAAFGSSRFDFLIQKKGRKMALEVKSCTLFGKNIAMFPDAPTARGSKHLTNLAELSKIGIKGGILFLIHYPHARFFIPDYHTDPVFTQNLCTVRNNILIKAIAVGWRKDLTLCPDVKEIEIPWRLIEKESIDSGSYIIVFFLKKNLKLHIGSLGEVRFKKGYYLYVGSAKTNLTKRIRRHQRKRKNLFWHIDYLRDRANFCMALPIRASEYLECSIARTLRDITERSISGFGASDCSCKSHLFGMSYDPLKSLAFIEALHYYRIGRLEEKL